MEVKPFTLVADLVFFFLFLPCPEDLQLIRDGLQNKLNCEL